MDSLLSATLEARCPERNHYRRYQIEVGQDLFGHWTVRVSYGRIGQRGRELRYGGPDAAELQAIVHRCLRRRLSAPGRIGCAYRLVDTRFEEQQEVSAWFPPKHIAGGQCRSDREVAS